MTPVSQPKRIKNIVILGGGTAGWMTAAALSRALKPENIKVTLVESDKIGTVGVGEATIPHIRTFNALLGLNETEFMEATQATYKLGIQFYGWGKADSDYFHPFSGFGKPYDNIDFQAIYQKARLAGLTLPLDAFSTANEACRQNKFCLPQAMPADSLNNFSYAYHLDATAYAQFLRQYAEQQGVTRIEGQLQSIQTCLADGHIQALTLDNNTKIEGDLFIDCSGFRALLIGQHLKSEYQNWTQWLKCDSAIAMQSEQQKTLAPYTRSTAHESGWFWQIPLQKRTGNGIVYSREYLSDDSALAKLTAQLNLTEPNPYNGPIRFNPGMRKQSWQKNCVAIGLASGFLEPLESTSIHLIQLSIFKLIELLPGDTQFETARAEFNRLIKDEYVNVRDFIILHYALNDRPENFWKACRDMALPQTLQNKIALFKAVGYLAQKEQGLFFKPSWQAVLFGQGLIPDGHDCKADILTNKQALDWVYTYLSKQKQSVENMPLHQKWLQQTGAMRK